jgi:ribosomal protein S18 acetylase RimI-like enzyme
MIKIRKAKKTDNNAIWDIIQPIIQKGDTYAFLPDSSREFILNYWCAKDKHTYIATINDEIVGTFILKDNQLGLGAHIANASYMVAMDKFGLGIGRFMGLFSIQEAKKLGYKAMQFNLVVKTNTRAADLWKSIGFTIIGEIPDAFNHQELGLVNAYIMYQKL